MILRTEGLLDILDGLLDKSDRDETEIQLQIKTGPSMQDIKFSIYLGILKDGDGSDELTQDNLVRSKK